MDKGILFILSTALISGVSIFLNAFGVQGLQPYAFTGMKNLLVAILLISIILLTTRARELKTLTPKQWSLLGLTGLVGGSIPFLLFFKGLSMGTGASGAFMHKTMILWVALGALLFLKERMNWKLIAGAAALLIGNFLLLKMTGITLSAGLAFTLIAALLWSAEILISKHLLKEVSGSTVAFGRMGIGAGIILAFLMASGHLTTILTWNSMAWGWVLVTSAFLLGYVWTFYNGLKLVNASTAAAILSLGSVITTILQLAFLGTTITLSQASGLVLLVAGAGLFWQLQRDIVQGTNSTAKA